MRSEIYLPNLDKIVPVRPHLEESLAEAPWALALLQKLSGYSPWTYEHSAKVAYLMGEMMENEGMSESGILKAQRAGWMHDVGKIQIPLTVLDSIASSEAGRRAMDEHPRFGFEMVREYDEELARIIVAHHEPLKGYPRSEARENGKGELLFFQNMLALCDATDALMSARPYKNPWIPEDVERDLDGKFDPRYIRMAVEIRAGINS